MNAPVRPGTLSAGATSVALPLSLPDPAIRFERVGKTYPGRRGQQPVSALAGIDLDVPAGTILGVIGRSGAGKSTLIRLVNGLERATEGRILIEGQDVTGLTESGWRQQRRRIGMIFQHFNLLSSRTVFDNVALPLEIAGASKAEIAAKVERLLALVGLSDKSARYPAELSGGQKQRVCIARALAAKPRLIICDEVTSALDPLVANGILKLLLELQQEEGVAYLFITHDLATVKSIADSIAVMYRGEVVRYGPKSQVLEPPFDAYTDLLLSSVPEMEMGWLEKAIKGRRMASAGN